MCFSKYSTRIVANVADVERFARNEFATICSQFTVQKIFLKITIAAKSSFGLANFPNQFKLTG